MPDSDTGTATLNPETLFSEQSPEPVWQNERGMLFADDCMAILPELDDERVDLVFCDPPFNLGKDYGKQSTDERSRRDYIGWCHRWLTECVRVLRPGGALFLYNLPKWNTLLGAFLMEAGLTFRHWIAIAQSGGFPIPNRLYPNHYSLLYLTRGKPKTFRRIRTPIETCRHCDRELKDYGGHRKSMNPRGVTLKDIWTDIPPVRHKKYKSKARSANALSTKLLDRVVEMATEPGDLVLDPFGGSGTTYAVCEKKDRRWIGIELNSTDAIIERLETGHPAHHPNDDVVDPR